MRRAGGFSCVVALILCVLLFTLSLSSCTGGTTGEEDPEIVCTIYPIYDLVRCVLGDRIAEHPVGVLSDNGNDPHNLQPSVRDIAAVKDASLFLYVGGASDAWAEELLSPDAVSVALLDVCDVCESDHGHGDEGEDGHGHDHHDHGEYDEHFWLSLTNAMQAVEEICRVLSEVYADDAETVADLRANADAYLASLAALDARYREAVESAALDTVLVADRFPFLYLMRDYGLTYHAAFPGCSTECDASFDTVARLSETLKGTEIPAVIITETGDRALAETVIRASGRENVEILVLHSCQSVTKKDRERGVTYLSIMENNLSVLTRALTP